MNNYERAFFHANNLYWHRVKLLDECNISHLVKGEERLPTFEIFL